MKTWKYLLTSCLIVGLFMASQVRVHAEVCDEYQCKIDEQSEDDYLKCNADKQSCLKGVIAETQSKANTLKNTISVLNGQVQIQQLQINQTLAEIQQLEKEITELGTRIDGLEISLDRMTNLLVERVNANYRHGNDDPILLMLASNSLSDFMSQLKYLKIAQKHVSEVMAKAENQRLTYDQQKSLKEEKQAEIEQKRITLQQQQNQLASQKQEQQQLLNVTQNDEAKYQKLLSQAQAEVASLKNYAQSKGGGTVPAQNSPDGWYFSQRDERWAGNRIGNSSENIMEVGCLISSTAMIKKKFGEDVNPASIAANTSYFFASTAYMLKPWPAPSGYHYVDVGFSQSRLDEQLEQNPVILKLSAGPYGTHFIVIKEKKDGKYIMHDPWEGYDKNFSDYYSFGQVISLSYLSR